MGKLNFTAERVSAFECAPGRQQSILRDGKTPGLGLRVTAAGAKAYVFEARLRGRTVRRTIGDPRTWTIREAQSEATRLKGLTDKNIDPREIEAQERASATEKVRAEVRQSVTVGQVWPEYMARVRALRSAKYVADHDRMASAGGVKRRRGESLTVAGPLAPLMPLRLADLTGSVIARWLSKEAETRPTDAAYAYRVLRAFIGWCAGSVDYSGIVPNESHRAREVRDVLPNAKPKHGDCLQREQLAAWFDAVRRLSNPVLRVYLQALLLTGARREEIARLCW
jgi:Arm domain-containing DNA-binding protein